MTDAVGVPPHDLEAESSVLGSILLAERWLDPLVAEVGLVADDFYRERHRSVFRAMLKLRDVGEPIDTLTVVAQLREVGELGEASDVAYVQTLVEKIPSIANARQYGQIVKENATLRRLLRASQEIQESIASRDGDPSELVDRAQARMLHVGQESQRGGLVELGELLHDELEHLELVANADATLTGTPSGLVDLDELTGGFQPGNLIVLAARPSMGKSALATTIAHNAADADHAVAIFSMEMSGSEVMQRMIASKARLPGDSLRKGIVSKDQWPRVIRAASELNNFSIYLDDESDQTVTGLRAKVRQVHSRRLAKTGAGLSLVIVDYLQLLRAEDPRANRVQQIEAMTRGLKSLARELEIPVLVISQLSREVDRRHPPRPMLSDLRDSGAIEQDADVVIFIYRDEYYTGLDTQRPGEADLIVAKHRNGATKDVAVAFIQHYPKFDDLVLEQPPQEDAGPAPFVLGRDDPDDLPTF